MSFGLRGGSFGGGNLNPFGTGQGGFGQYNIGSAASEEAGLDKYAAQVAWNQGRITDDAYVAALVKYAGTTEKGTREYIAAHDDILDARYTISRNEIVNSLNRATGTARRISLWQDLISVDRRRLMTMGAQDNEQRRELASRIDEEQGNIRSEQWSDMVRRYNDGKVSIDRMLRAARRHAGSSQGSRDHQGWLDEVDKWTETKDDDTLRVLNEEWQRHPNTGGAAVLRFLDQRIARVSRESPQYAQLAAQREQVVTSIRVQRNSKSDGDMTAARDQGTVSDEAWVQYWAKRLKDSEPGSDDRRAMKVKVYDETFKVSVKHGQQTWADTGDPSRLLGVYNAALQGLAYGTDAYRQMQQTILEVQSSAWGTLDVLRGTPNRSGGTIFVGGNYGAPPGGPGTGANGFASQYDGSDFANQNCGYTAAAMLAWAAGVEGLSGGDMRWYAGDPSGASFLSGMATAMERVGLGLETNQGLGMEKFRRRVANGEAAIVNGLYGNLGGQFRLSSFAGAHSVTVTQARKSGGTWWYYVMDPIGRNARTGAQWWPEEVMRNFAWSGATNPISGNPLSGVVAFARKGGSVVRSRGRQMTVPFQAFDTDANGKSTIGKGGGNSRAEAGYMPPDFAKRARGGEKGTSTDDIAVWTFLGAISKVATADEMPQNPAEERQWVKRAKRLLERYDGDVQLAAADWFTAGAVDANTTTWAKDQLWYANAVGNQFKLPPLTAGDPAVQPGEPGPGTPGTEAPGGLAADMALPPGAPTDDPQKPDADATDLAIAQSDITKRETQPTASLSGYSDAILDIARRSLKAAGMPYSISNMQVIISALEAVNGDKDIKATNPWNLTTDQEGRFEGQTGIGPDGEPQFLGASDPSQAAIEAWAEIVPQSVVSASRTGNTRRFLDSFGKSGMSEVFNDNNLVHIHNDNPETIKAYGLPMGLDVPSSLADNAKSDPEIAALFNIDPTDARQVAWYRENVGNMKAANTAGADEWQFRHSDGTISSLPFAPFLLVEMADNAMEVSLVQADLLISQGRSDEGVEALREGIAGLDPAAMTLEGLRKVSEQMHLAADQQMYLPGGAARAYRTLQDLQLIYAQVLGSAEEVTSQNQLGTPSTSLRLVADIGLVTNPSLRAPGAEDELAAIGKLVEQDANHPLLWLMQPNNGVTGFDENGNINPDRGFVTWTVASDGTVKPEIVADTLVNQELFRKVKRATPDGAEVEVPAYADPAVGGWVPVILPGGEKVWQKPKPFGTPVEMYSNQSVSTAHEGLGPEEKVYRGRVVLGSSIDIPDPTDPDHRRVVTYWSMGANPDGTQTWLGLSSGKSPTLIYTGKGKLADDGAGGFTINGQKANLSDMIAAGELVPYGTGGDSTRVKGVGGTGAPRADFIVRTSGVGEPLDGTLSDMDRYSLGGDMWPRGKPAPVNRTVSTDRFVFEQADAKGFYDKIPPRYGEVAPSSPEMDAITKGIRDISNSGAPAGQYGFGKPTGDTGNVLDQASLDAIRGNSAPHGSPRVSDTTAFLRNSVVPVFQNILAAAAQSRQLQLQSAATARAGALHREAVARTAAARVEDARLRPTYAPPRLGPPAPKPRPSQPPAGWSAGTTPKPVVPAAPKPPPQPPRGPRRE